MKAGIIAAGKGERLVRGGIPVPKPLVPVCGEPMIARAIRAAARLKVTSIACIVNNLHPEVAGYLRSGHWPVPLELVVKNTSSSMESLFELAPFLDTGPFMLFTVDAVFPFETLDPFLFKARGIHGASGVLALTRFVDDEKPLWVETDADQKITAMGNDAGPCPYVTAGFYYFHPDIFTEVRAARAVKLGALRQFLGLLVDSGHAIYGLPVSKTLDVDYPEDIEKAEGFLREIGEDA
jgi:NDP-sugar pyrophosphorylase family protein